ncbi:hypothetical protein PSTT_09955, partial [Puccinia striiformis]
LSEGTGVCFPNFCVFTLYPTCHPAAKHPVSKDRHEACVLHEDAKGIQSCRHKYIFSTSGTIICLSFSTSHKQVQKTIVVLQERIRFFSDCSQKLPNQS